MQASTRLLPTSCKNQISLFCCFCFSSSTIYLLKLKTKLQEAETVTQRHSIDDCKITGNLSALLYIHSSQSSITATVCDILPARYSVYKRPISKKSSFSSKMGITYFSHSGFLHIHSQNQLTQAIRCPGSVL